MKIVHIIPGSGGSFYCGNCLRDSKYYSSIKKLGHDVLKIPMYLPLFSHDTNHEEVPVFYGAVSIYLKQTYPFFKKAPKWFDNMLNTRPVLKQAAKMAGSTRAKGLEEMTISMLLGEHGDQAEELEKMIRWLEEHYRPDVVHLSNALLLGLAGRLKSRLGVPVVCSLQDEDVWVDVMSEANREAFGIYLAEAMASGIPVVQPPAGAFPEIIETTGGGVISSENTPGKLAVALGKILDDKKMLQELSTNARRGVDEKLNINTQASKLVEIYRKL